MQLDSLDEVSDSLHSSPPRKYLRFSLDNNIGVANVESENSIKAEVSHLVSRLRNFNKFVARLLFFLNCSSFVLELFSLI